MMKQRQWLSILLLAALWTACLAPGGTALAGAPTLLVPPQAGAANGGTGTPVSLTATQQYEANIFLSNFSEQGFASGTDGPFDTKAAGEAELFSFAHRWAKINRRSAISYSGSYEVMTLAAVNEILERYLEGDCALNPAEGTDYSAALGMGHFDWDHCWYSGGCFYYPAADGESYNCFTVVTEKLQYPSGLSTLCFTVYELDLSLYWEHNGIPAEYYRLTPAEAAQRAQKGEITPMRMGEALCSPWLLTAQNRESYRLLRYELYPLDMD